MNFEENSSYTGWTEKPCPSYSERKRRCHNFLNPGISHIFRQPLNDCIYSVASGYKEKR